MVDQLNRPELRHSGKSLVQLREEYAAIARLAKPLAERVNAGESLTDDENKSFDEYVARLNEVGPELKVREMQQKHADSLLDADASYNQPQKTDRASGKVPNQKKRPATLGHRFTASDQYQAYAERPTGSSAKMGVTSFYNAPPEDDDVEVRTLIYTGATANLVNGDRLGGIYRPLLQPFQVDMRDVLINGQTDSNAIEYVQELAFTNAAAETAEAVSTVTGAKPESALTFQIVTSNVKLIAHWVPITRQTVQDAAQVETYVNARLIEGLRLRENLQIVAGDGTGANLTGLLSTSGIGNLDAAYWTANPLPTVAAAANNLDRLRRAKKYVAVTGLANASFVVLHPDDAEKFDELKTTTGEYVVSDPTTYNPIRRLWNMTVVENTGITAGNFLVGSGTDAAVFDRMDAQIFMSDSHSDFFIRNIFTILAEERIALAVFRPSAFAKGVFV